MALFTSHLGVQTGEWIARFGMVEVLGRFPVFDVMALGAFIAELTLVRVVVAGLAKR